VCGKGKCGIFFETKRRMYLDEMDDILV